MLMRMYIGSFFVIAARYLLVAVSPLVFLHSGATPGQVGLLVGLAFLMQLLASPSLGKYADTRGRKPALLLGASMMVLGGMVIFLFPTILGFIIGQILFGLGPAAFFSAAFALVAEVSPTERRGSSIARFGILINVAEAIAPPIGLYIAFGGKPYSFLSAAILAFLAIPAFANLKHQTNPKQSGENHKDLIPAPWWVPLLLTAALAISYGVINAYLPEKAATDHTNAGWFFTTNFGIQVVLRLIANKTFDHYPRQILLAFGAGFMTLATILLTYFTNSVGLLFLGAIYGIGNFYITPSLVTWLVDLSETRKGTSMAAYNASFGAGVAIGSMVLGPILFFFHSVSFTFWIAGLFSALGVFSLLTLKNKEPKRKAV